MSFTTAALVVAWLAILILAFGFAGLLVQVSDLRRALGGASGSGSAAPGEPVIGLALPASGPLAGLRPHGGGVVAFVSPGCPSCEAVLADLDEHHPTAGELVIVSTGDCPAVAGGGPVRCLADQGDTLAALHVPATPYLLAVDAAGTITGSLLPLDDDDLRHWLTHTTGQGAHP